MTEVLPSRANIEAVLKKAKSLPSNKGCFDCHAKNPTWCSVTYGVLICLECSAVHRGLGVHLSFVRSTQLDTNWTWVHLYNMHLGGNANAEKFFRDHNCNTLDAQQKYNSRAANLYREKLNRHSQESLRMYGNKIHLELLSHEPTLTEKKEIDFFEEHSKNISASPPELSDSSHLAIHHVALNNGNSDDIGPKVDSVLNSSAQKPDEPRKSTIGQRKPNAKVGAKKLGGFGAQRVKKDFAAIEKEAELNDQLKQHRKVEPTKEERQQSLVSLQEAYENMSLASKKEEERMKRIDPKKAEQAERLGMALGSRSGVSHSMFSEMKSIEQENSTPKSNYSSLSKNTFKESDIDEELDAIIRFSTGPPKYKDSPFEDKFSSFSGGFSNRASGIDDLLSKKESNSDWENEFEKIEKPKDINMNGSRSLSTKYAAPIDDNKAQEKFGNAKAISSEQFFHGQDPDFETRSNLSRFQGSSAISSSDFFGEKTPKSSYSHSYDVQTPNMDEVRESVRQGVTKVAGRLSNIASNTMSILQDRFQQ